MRGIAAGALNGWREGGAREERARGRPNARGAVGVGW